MDVAQQINEDYDALIKVYKKADSSSFSGVSGTTISEIEDSLKKMSEDELEDLFQELMKQYDLWPILLQISFSFNHSTTIHKFISFHEFLGLIFGGFLTFGPTMWRQRRRQPRSIHPLDSLPQKRSSIIHCTLQVFVNFCPVSLNSQHWVLPNKTFDICQKMYDDQNLG